MLSLQSRIRDPRLLPLADKVLRGERLSFEDGLLLYETPDLNGVGAMAHQYGSGSMATPPTTW